VVALPPYKQTPANKSEKQGQARRKDQLQQVASACRNEKFFSAKRILLSVKYQRARGLADAANIIGGIADALEGILYLDDNRITEVHYVEESAPEATFDEYWVEVTET